MSGLKFFNSDCKVIIPEYFYHHFCAANPGLSSQIHAIPACSDARVSLNWEQDYCFHQYGNALNLLLLPLASMVQVTPSYLK